MNAPKYLTEQEYNVLVKQYESTGKDSKGINVEKQYLSTAYNVLDYMIETFLLMKGEKANKENKKKYLDIYSDGIFGLCIYILKDLIKGNNNYDPLSLNDVFTHKFNYEEIILTGLRVVMKHKNKVEINKKTK